MRIDADGELWLFAAGAIIGVVAQYTSNVIEGVAFEGESLSSAMKIRKEDIIGLVSSGVSGALSVSGMSAMAMTASNALLNSTAYLAECGYRKEKVDFLELTASVSVGIVMDKVGASFDGTRAREVVKTANKYIAKSSSVKKQAMYIAKKATVRKSVAKYGLSTAGSASIGMAASKLFVKAGRWLSSIFK